MTYIDENIGRRRHRNRKITWFNPPFSANVTTNVGHEFLKIVKKCFNKQHKFFKLFNKNTFKISYSCVTNVQNIIKQHNAKITNADVKLTQKPCNCRVKENCPLDGDCLTTCIIYRADVAHENNVSTYYGQCEGEFKTRFNNHTKSFRQVRYRNETTLSALIWKLKEDGSNYNIKWSIATYASLKK